MRLLVLLPALTAGLAGAEGRLVFPAFGEYIRLHPPFNYIAVTAALYGVALLVFLHVAGAVLHSLSFRPSGNVSTPSGNVSMCLGLEGLQQPCLLLRMSHVQ